MSWGEPLWFFGMLIVPFVAALVLLDALNRRRARMRFLRGEQPPLPRGWGANLLVLPVVVALLIFALTDPRWGETTDEVERKGADIVLLLDLSRSMLAEDARPSRLERAKREIRGLLSLLGDDRVALVTFAGTADVVCPLTEDHRVFEYILEDIGIHSLADGGSNLSKGLELALEGFDERTAGRAIVLLTDGEFQGEDPKFMLQPYREREIPIYVIGIGTADGAKIPIVNDNGRRAFLTDGKGQEVISRLGRDILTEIAEATGGEFLSTQDTAFPMDEMYEKRVRFLSAEAYASATMSRMPPRFQVPVFLALGILVLFWFPRRSSRVRGIKFTTLVLLAPLALLASPLDARAQAESSRASYGELDKRARDVGRHPGDPRYLYNYGTTLHEAGRHTQAAEVLGDALNMSKERPVRRDELLSRDAAYNLGNTFFRGAEQEQDAATLRKGMENALSAYAEALRRDPADEQARHNLAMTLRMLSQNPPPSGGQNSNSSQQQQQQDQQDQQNPQNQQNQGQQQQDQQDQQQQQQNQQGGDPQNQTDQQQQASNSQQAPVDERQIEDKLDEAERTQRQIDNWKKERRRRRRTRDW